MIIEHIYNLFLLSKGITIDSRNVTPGQIFISLKGDNFDGNKFAKSALDAGAAFAIVENLPITDDNRYIVVDDGLKTLQLLANIHRKKMNVPTFALTGSNGKTTTKELISRVLSKKYKVHATKGNLNNHIGVPLTILSAPIDTQFLFIEMGANHQGEIARLCQIAEPNFVAITNIGKAHLEGFGGEQGVIKGKGEIYAFASQNDALVFINDEDPVLLSILNPKTKTVRYHGDSMLSCPSSQNPLVLQWNDIILKTHLYGQYNIGNISLAITVGMYFDVPSIDIQEALESYTPENNRSQIKDLRSNKLIMDAYNANPSSMKASLENLSAIPGKKMVILGDMLELGESTEPEHTKVLELIQSFDLYDTIFIGEHFYKLKDSFAGNFFLTTSDAKIYFNSLKLENTTILIKGSRGLAVEKIFD